MALRYLGVNNVTENELYIRANTEADHGVDTVPLAKAIRSLTIQIFQRSINQMIEN